MENTYEMEAIHSTEVKLRDGIAQIRQCSFRPEEHFINLEIDGQKKPRYYLTVDWRLFWLQLWCQENGMEYCVEEQPVVILPGTTWIQTVCTVVIDGKIAGQGIGGINLNQSQRGERWQMPGLVLCLPAHLRARAAELRSRVTAASLLISSCFSRRSSIHPTETQCRYRHRLRFSRTLRRCQRTQGVIINHSSRNPRRPLSLLQDRRRRHRSVRNAREPGRRLFHSRFP